MLPLPTADARLGWLAARLGELPGSGIVYALTVSAAEDTAALLREAGHEVRAYTGRTDPADRLELERALRDNQVKALVATSALGMGFDKPDLGFVVHLGAPASPVAYYQQVGRAGRATERADVLLLPGARGPRDLALLRDRVDAAPGRRRRRARPRWPSRPSRCRRPRWRRWPTSAAPGSSCCSRCSTSRAPCAAVSGGWSSTGAGWTYDEQRYARVAAARDAEAASMLDYIGTDGCRMRFLQEALDDPGAADCGRCDRCAGAWYDATVPDGAVQAATRTLRKVGVPVEPRSQWPSGMSRLGVARSGRISADEQVEQGRVVARLTDLGWGQRLRASCWPSRRPDAPADDRLLAACVEVLAGWDWDAAPGRGRGRCPRCGDRSWWPRSPATSLALGRLDDLGTLDADHRGADRRPGRQQRVPAGRGARPVHRPAGPGRPADRAGRPGAARRRPGRLALDRHRGGRPAAAGRRTGGAAVRPRRSSLTAPRRSLRLVVLAAADPERLGEPGVHQVRDQPLRRVRQVVAVVHPDPGVVGDERDVVAVAAGHVERVDPPRAAGRLHAVAGQDDRVVAVQVHRVHRAAVVLDVHPHDVALLARRTSARPGTGGR